MYTAPSSRSSVTSLSIILKKMLNRVGARTQPFFTPLTMGKNPNRSLVFVELDNHAEEIQWAAKALHDHPQSLSAHCIKRYIQPFLLLPAFLFELSEDEHHFCGALVGSEPTLRPPTNECPILDTKQSEGETPVILELLGIRSTPTLPSLPDPPGSDC